MAQSLSSTLNVHQAVETLSRLQAAAPPNTANKLAQVVDLLRMLADENTYLNTLLLEEPSPQYAEPEDDILDPEPAKLQNQVAPLSSDMSLWSGLNDALRPPLVAIRGRAELVQAGLLGQITDEQDSWLQAIQENTDRAFSVLDATQEIITLHKGQTLIEWMNFISTDLLTEAWERKRDMARMYNHEMTIHAPDNVPLARGDFYQSLIILTDLLDNALRYTPAGGQIRLSVDNLGTHVLFTVADNGIGLTADDLQNVGLPFWRGDYQKLVRQHPGTGLRLYLAKQVLPLQEGELIFSGEPGLGSTFSFTLRVPE
jgi:signal transduction histidine kinase